MTIDLNTLSKPADNTPLASSTTAPTPAPKSPMPTGYKVALGVLSIGLISSLLYNCQGKPATADVEKTVTASVSADGKVTLPKGVTKLSKLPFELPKFFTTEPKEIYKVGSIYVIGTLDENGNLVYDSLTSDGKFLMPTYIADSTSGQVIIDSNGFVPADATTAQANTGQLGQQANAQAQAQTTAPTNAQTQSDFTTLPEHSYLANGMPASYFTDDLTKGNHSFKPETSVITPAIGELKTNPDLFARHIFDSLYNSTWHSDSLEGKYKQSPHSPMYVVYDPNCPHCQIEIPQVEQLKAQGYPVIYLPVPALSQAPNPLSDDDFHYQLFAPHLGKQPLLETLTSKQAYVRPKDFTMSDQQKGYAEANRGIFVDLPDLLASYYSQKYSNDFSTKYGTIAKLAVPSVIYLDKTTGDVHYSNMTDELLGTSIVR